VHDITEVPNLLHGEEDAAFLEACKRDGNKHLDVVWMINQRVSKRKKMCKVTFDVEKGIAAMRAHVGHVFVLQELNISLAITKLAIADWLKILTDYTFSPVLLICCARGITLEIWLLGQISSRSDKSKP